ncbi:MAG: flagellar filament capping protein FliD [Spirochaetales bacterium]|nr:flagellar filament capping protein FliD [Spirochaetales bacterium]
MKAAMSDISIPGVTSKYNTDSMIDELMRLERIPLTRMENQVEDYEFERQAWKDLNLNLSKFRDSSKKLYGFQNPFNERVATSSDSDYLTATANRDSMEGSSEIEIIQLAKADRLLSSSLDEDYRIESGTYSFQVGDDEVSIRFRGGSLKSFADTINRRSGGLLRASVVRNTANTQILSLEASKTGAENRLFFESDSIELAKELGLIEEVRNELIELGPEPADFREWERPLDSSSLSISASGGVTLPPVTEGKIPLSMSGSQLAGKILEYTLDVQVLPEQIAAVETPPPGPSIPPTGSIEFGDISIFSATSKVDIPAWEPPLPPPRTDDLSVFFLQEGDRVVSLDNIPAGETSSRTYRIELNDKVGSLSSFNIRNNNTHREVSVSGIKIYDPNARGDYVPANPISTARDSIINIDGIPITRDSNQIEDVVPGVTLNIKRESDEPITLDVGPDRELVKEDIINFVGTYNRVVAEINILTGSDTDIIDQLDYFTSEEKEDARKKLGLYQGDSTLRQMKSRLQRIMMEPYTTSAEQSLALLAQVGISTNSASGGYDSTRMKGYLEIEEDTLDASLESLFEPIKELFGQDSDGDLIIDSGVAYELDNYAKSYVETGGIISYKVSSLDTRIDNTKDDIDDYNDKLETKEQQLRTEYGMMEGALESMQDSTRALNNLNNNNGN